MSQLQVTGEAKIRDIQGPVVSNSGVITALDGDASQYVRGDGTLADFPTSTGGGSSVSYYLNSSVSQGTIGGVAYRQLSKDPISGAGTDITISANGYVASYITDANDPALLEVPAGNFNCEFYFSVNSNAHNPYVYAELYKYDGTAFTLLGSNVAIPEYLTNGTTLSAYYFAIPVAVAALTITDRLAIRIYVNVDGRTVTLHTENSHLCQVVTTFSKGLISLNNLTRQNQFFATGTSGTDFGISSSVATHTFNLPVASAANTGKLSSTDWSTFNGKVPYTGATGSVDLGVYNLTAFGVSAKAIEVTGNGTQGGYLYIKQGILPFGTSLGSNAITADGTKYVLIANVDASNNKIALLELGSITNNTSRTFTLPDITGTLALLEGSQTFTGSKIFSANPSIDAGGQSSLSILSSTGNSALILGYVNSVLKGTIEISATEFKLISAIDNILKFQSSTNFRASLIFSSTADYSYTYPNASGTIALTSNLSSYVPYTGATGAVNLGAFDLTVNSVKVGRGNGSISTNSVLGETALNSNTTGSTNTAIGYGALQLNTTGLSNTAIGHAALNYNTTSSWNTAVGVSALGLSTGGQNTAIGYAALGNNTTGVFNIAIGYTTGTSIVTGNYNTIIGNYAGTAAMSNNIVLADGQGNIRYQWNGTNNVFGNPLSGTSATFSSSLGVNSTIRPTGQTDPTSGVGMELFYRAADTSSYIQSYDRTNSAWKDVRIYGNTLYFGSQGTNNLTIASTGAATFSNNILSTNPTSNTINLTVDTGYNFKGFNGYWGFRTGTAFDFNLDTYNANTQINVLKILQTGAATFSSSVTAGVLSRIGDVFIGGRSGTYAAYTDGVFGDNLHLGATSVGGAVYINTALSRNLIINPVGGNVGIGTSSPSYLLDLKASATPLRIVNTIATSNQQAWIKLRQADSSNFGADIGIDTTTGGDFVIGRNDGTDTFTEAFRIKRSNGNILIGTTASVYSVPSKFELSYDGNTIYGINIKTTAGDGTNINFVNSSGSQVGSIYSTASVTTYNVTSDYRLKEDFKEVKGLESISAIKVYDFKWKAEDSRMDGVIAHELAEVLPYAVTGKKDGEQMQQVDYSKLVPILVKAIQEQQQMIEELKALIAAK